MYPFLREKFGYSNAIQNSQQRNYDKSGFDLGSDLAEGDRLVVRRMKKVGCRLEYDWLEFFHQDYQVKTTVVAVNPRSLRA